MAEMILTDEKCWNGIYIFLMKLWGLDPKKYASCGIGLGAFLDFWRCHWRDDCEWRRTWLSVFKRSWSNETISSNNAAQLALALLIRYQNKYCFDLSASQKLLREMQSASYSHEKELQLWHEALQEVENGIKREVITRYRFSDWAS
jgi:hypothetical protein